MCFHRISFILLFSLIIFSAKGQINVNSDAAINTKHPDSLLTVPKNQLKAAGLILATNVSVWAYDRFIVGGNYARINLNTIKRNFKTGFTGDNDGFLTNLLSHPYHGIMYFNSARSNGMNFWQSVPFTASGSLMWEFFMENETPAINDFISSTVGGSCLGEMSYRISDQLIDERTVGFERFKREALLTIISPIRGLNRILNGEAWNHRNSRGNTLPSIPISFYSTIGYRMIIDNSQKYNNVIQMTCYDVNVNYGNPFDPDNEKPYDFFTIKISGNLFSPQSIVGQVNGKGLIFSKNISFQKSGDQMTLGIFQYFNFFQVDNEINHVSITPFKISEAASFGPGLMFKSNLTGNLLFTGSAHLGAVLLGGYNNDYHENNIRNYNMGSGYSSKFNMALQYGNRLSLSLNLENYQIYSWIGNLQSLTLTKGPIDYGDNGNAGVRVVALNLNYKISQHLIVTAETGFFHGINNYKYYPVVNHSLTGNKLSIGYIF